jgi:hemerythrin-like domain-containing protein
MSAVIDLLKRQHVEVLARIDRDHERFGDPAIAGEFLDFLGGEVVAHFRLEEEVLFPELAQVPAIADGPLRVMNAEHSEFRTLLAAGMAARERGDTHGVGAAASDLAMLLRGHIAKEDRALFPMALNVLSAEQLRSIDASSATTY